MWCDGGDSCKESIRERVVGENNNLEFEGPATGQVCFTWDDREQCELQGEDKRTATASVLLLVKKGDNNALMEKAAEAVKELTESGVQVYLVPDMAAKIEHYYRRQE